jgi:3-hydroxyisobutyrate dehydrogenase
MAPRIGFIGVGRMGLPMCVNLARAGYRVTAADRRDELEDVVVAAGVRWRGSAAEAAADVDVLITMLPGPSEVRAAMLGSGGALGALRDGTSWIDTSSISPRTGREIAERALARGVEVLDAPVGGGPSRARDGTLQLFVGGDAGALERHRELFEVLADPRRIVHVGARGAGYTAKLLANLLWFGQAVATAEALLLARRAGIDLDRLRDALAASAATGEFIRHDVDALLAGDYLESFGLDRCCEELDAIVALARDLDVPFECSALVESIHRRALERFGAVDGELLAVALLEEEAGITLRRGPTATEWP